YRESSEDKTPWGGDESPALVTAVESELERRLSAILMKTADRLPRRRLEPGETLVEQGQPGRSLFLLLDGVLEVEVDGDAVAQVGPGAMVGERAGLEKGVRTATLRALTPCRVVVVPSDALSPEAVAALASLHRPPA
ncbi:MAG: cyclic nucleotide-binding domain-containing protein, partial [Actinomycetota bacterium]|nr:cyclic nucleotide-binding domain-containing protein [Actinomycetota bacterium]